ncbi:ComF family protein [Chlorobium sp. N1]|uniref:ComF family protein n=1 Tax=Chlorobium sp. N1 TaxID=2491138 RepID=UPI00103C2394|nr:ComF family protein [Chlorobium sp. N1]TCD47806.1 ComF family protein [Chlorobium sp. N1]
MSGRALLRELLHPLFPDVCVVCSSMLREDEDFCCSACRREFSPFPSAVEAEMMLRSTIARRIGPEFLFDRGWCRYLFHKGSPLQEALHAMKYGGVHALCAVFGRELGEWMLTEGKGEVPFDIVVPVPLHRMKKTERTYNQAEKIAGGLSAVMGMPVMDRLLVRRRRTPSQTGLAAVDRLRNLAGAFSASGVPRGARVLLVDDVVTTGATMSAAADALMRAGAGSISLAAVALAAKE